ncbi:MAG TPA: MASE1 domain-containing protein [Gemmataceae bacterium]|jgi:PAS domain S-box-containing protein|nr:MASE1 domain-containing protein [Gemmataceae bacterium]
MRRRHLSYLAKVLALAAIYLGAAKLGLSMAFVAEQVTPVWPPTGISIAAILILGYRVWPGIALGAFLANATANEPIGTAIGIAVGNTLEAIVAVWLLKQFADFDRSLSRLRDVLAFLLVTASVSTALCATIGVSGLCLGGVQPWRAFADVWLVWWLGDATGALLVAPTILTWASISISSGWQRRLPEIIALAGALLLVGLTIFAAQLPWVTTDHPLEYAIFPLVIWAALRFGQRGTAAVTLAASAFAIWGTVNGSGPFSRGTIHENLILLQTFLAAVTATALLLGAALAERNRADRRRLIDLGITHILSESASLEEASPKILKSICQGLDWDVGEIWRVDREFQLLRYVEIWNQPDWPVPRFLEVSQQLTFVSGLGLPGRVWMHGEPAWIPDVAMDANFPRASAAARDGLRGALAFPIRLGDEVLGVMEFFSREVQRPDRQLLQVFAGIGSQIGHFVQRKRANEQLRISERNLRLIAENTSDVVIAYDLGRELLYVNPAFEEFTGYTIAELRSRKSIDYLHQDDAPRMLKLMEGLYAGGAFDGEEFRIVTRAGEVKWCLSSWGPLLDSDGTRIGIQGRECDISARKHAEDALREADRRKDEFLAMLAHELRNPLAPIRNAIHVIGQAGANLATLQKPQAIAERQVQHMARLLDDLLDVSRISRGRIELRKEIVDMSTIIKRAVEAVQLLIEEKGHQLTVSLPDGPLIVEADAARMEQVLTNLLNNAAKYTDSRGSIWLTAAHVDDAARLHVRVTDKDSVRHFGLSFSSHLAQVIFPLSVTDVRQGRSGHSGRSAETPRSRARPARHGL